MALRDALDGAWCPSLGVTAGTLLDRSGRNNHGTLTNMDPSTDWVQSGGRGALDFDGVNDRVQMIGSGPTSARRTVSLWMRYPGPGTGFRCAFDYGVTGTLGARLFIGWNGQNIIMDRFGGGLSVSGYYDFAWHHVVVTDRAGDYQLWVDGKLGASGTQASTPTAGPIRLGSALDGPLFPGQIDDVATWRRDLTPPEIWQLYQQGRGGWLRERRRRTYGFVAAGFKAYWARQRTGIIGGGVR